MEFIRAFIAIEIDPDIRERLEKLQQKLRPARADLKWVKAENIHLTLAFLGRLPVEKVPLLETALSKNIQRLQPLTLRIEGVGVFGRRSRPSVIWAGIQENSDLTALHQHVVDALQTAVIPFDPKRLRPHLTLGRFKSLKQLTPLFQLLEKEEHSTFGIMKVRSIQLIQSDLKPSGAEHTVLYRVPFSRTAC